MMLHNAVEVEEEELFFPIDTADYPRSALVKNGRVAIYAISTKERTPTKIGISADLGGRISALQTFNWNDLYLYYAVWLPGKEIAILIASAVHFKLQQHKLNGEWFTVSPTIAKKTILEEASRVCGNIRLVDHREMVNILKAKKSP